MSRVGRKVIAVPKDVKVTVSDDKLTTEETTTVTIGS